MVMDTAVDPRTSDSAVASTDIVVRAMLTAEKDANQNTENVEMMYRSRQRRRLNAENKEQGRNVAMGIVVLQKDGVERVPTTVPHQIAK
jgi:hypothetical protein